MSSSAAAQDNSDVPVRVVIVDDSALMRRVLVDVFESDPGIEVVGVAPDAIVARDVIKSTDPDVITLDVEMPKMDGLQFLKNIMRLRPTPVVMISSLTAKGADVALQALAMGAIDVVGKPKIDLASTIYDYAEEIISKVKVASKSSVTAIDFEAQEESAKSLAASRATQPKTALNYTTTEQLIAIGGSTGGTEAIGQVLASLPASSPGTVIVQHIPKSFSAPFAARLDRNSAMSVCEAKDGQQIMRGHAYVAPGDQHLSVYRDGAKYHCRLTDSDPVNRHRPSVDVLFDSVAEHAGHNSVGVILTGMGDDGARGLLAMKSAGSPTVVQNEATSVVWGMPGSAVHCGAADEVVPLGKVAERVLGLVQKL